LFGLGEVVGSFVGFVKGEVWDRGFVGDIFGER
jgi:hypothetical protein